MKYSDAAGRTNPQVIQQFDDRDCERRRAFLGGCVWEKRLGYYYENTLLRSELPQEQWPMGAVEVQQPV